MIDAGRGGDEGLVVDDAVRELAADDVGVCGELFEGGGRDVDVVRYARVVVSNSKSVNKCLARRCWNEATHINTGTGDRSATASNHFRIPI